MNEKKELQEKIEDLESRIEQLWKQSNAILKGSIEMGKDLEKINNNR